MRGESCDFSKTKNMIISKGNENHNRLTSGKLLLNESEQLALVAASRDLGWPVLRRWSQASREEILWESSDADSIGRARREGGSKATD